ncbi:hypothetical protein DPEC_G00268100 [Dallia pectoralis]|uniref:Uncharacterized protein n=1 Tax=Dallia pectoralis TaxID=75939 RepID=A0ACC2FNN8_DALPE|nr:hypothetical protein DPEC_G00268100 [Dallia pectoralis]
MIKRSPEPNTCCLSLPPTSSHSSSAPSYLGPTPEREAYRTISDPFPYSRTPLYSVCSRPRSFLEAEHWPDQTTRAPLSLPHLGKVTTTYGFVTLTQSPQMANQEALLCPPHTHTHTQG